MKTNKVSRTVVENALINTRTIKEIKENNIDVYDKDDNKLDITSIEGLTKAHTTMSRAYPYIYDAIYNIINDKNYITFIDKDSDKYFYKIEISFNKFLELSLGNSKNNGQQPYLIKELKTFKIENKLIIAKEKKTKINRYLHAPALFFVLDNQGGKVIKSNLDQNEYRTKTTITIYFFKELFYEAVEKKNYSFFYIPKNMYANSKRLIEYFNLLESNFFSDISVTQYTKSIYYLLTKNNKTSKKSKTKKGLEKKTPSEMNIDLYDYAKHVYPEAIVPNRHKVRYTAKLISLIQKSIWIYNIILTQNKITNSTITLSFSITDNNNINKKDCIVVPISQYSDIEIETLDILSYIMMNLVIFNHSLFDDDKYKFVENKTELKRELKKLKAITHENVTNIFQYKEIILTGLDENTKHKVKLIIKNILKYL